MPPSKLSRILSQRPTLMKPLHKPPRTPRPPRKRVATQLAAGITYLQNQVEDRKKSIGNLVGNLLAAQASCNTAANVLEPLLEELGSEVQGAFGVDPHALINGLSTMAFSLEGNPATAVQAGSQISSVVLDGLSTVIDNDGNPAPKGSILGPVRSLEGDLKTELTGLKGDFTDVSGSDRIKCERVVLIAGQPR